MLVDRGSTSHRVDPGLFPSLEQHTRHYYPPKIVHRDGPRELLAIATARLTIRLRDSDGTTREVNMSLLIVPKLDRNLLSSTAAHQNGLVTIITTRPRLVSGNASFPSRAENTLYFLDTVLPEPERVHVGRVADGLLWHRRLGHINLQSRKFPRTCRELVLHFTKRTFEQWIV